MNELAYCLNDKPKVLWAGLPFEVTAVETMKKGQRIHGRWVGDFFSFQMSFGHGVKTFIGTRTDFGPITEENDPQ